MKTIKVEKIIFENRAMWKLCFAFDREIIALIKTIRGAWWNPLGKFWYFPFETGSIAWLNHKFAGTLTFIEDNKPLPKDAMPIDTHKSGPEDRSFKNSPEASSAMAEYLKSLIVKQYSPRTIDTYSSMLRLFMQFFENRDINLLTDEEIRNYLLFLIDKKKVSASYQNQAINAIKYYFEQVLGRETKTYYLSRPRPATRYPTVLSEEEVIMIISQIDNLKHRMVISLIYSAGLRISEAINMKLVDIDSKRGYIMVRGGKGKKDRRTLLSKSVLIQLRLYYQVYRPKIWIFEGQDGGQYSDESIQTVFRKAVHLAGIRKRVTVHTLRHSFATHLLERGVNLRYIQSLLGHCSSRTTEIYTHVTNKGLLDIKSPFDNLSF